MNTNLKITLTALAAVMLLGKAQAQNGTWINATTGGIWSAAETTNWSGGTVASGSGNTADFSTLDITATNTVTLGESTIIGNLIFDDTTPSHGWTLNGGGNELTLAGTNPTITVNSSTAMISAVIDGTDGLVKEGAGTLRLNAANTFSGGVSLNTGKLLLSNSGALGGNAVNQTTGTSVQLQGGINIGNTLNIIGTGTNANSAIWNALNSNTISGGITLLGDARISAANSSGNKLTLSGPINIGAHRLLMTGQVSSIPIDIDGQIIGTGVLEHSQGILTVNSDNSAATFNTKLAAFNGAQVRVGHDNAFGTGTIEFAIQNDATTTFRSTNSTDRTISNELIFSNSGTGGSEYAFGGGGSGNLLFTGNVTLNVTRQFWIQNSVTEFSGSVGGTGGINKTSNSGTLILSGTNSYAGSTSTSNGTILLNGTHTGGGNYNVTGTGTLGGTGSTTSDVSVTGGTLSPGASVESLGVGGLTIDGGTYLYEINSDLADSADLTFASDGTMAIALNNDPTLTLANLGSDPVANGAKYTLFSYNDGLTGTFAGIADLSTFTALGTDWTINYADSVAGSNFTSDAVLNGTSFVTITAIPEPGTLMLVGISLLAVLAFRKRR